jgi:hypothetical protein
LGASRGRGEEELASRRQIKITTTITIRKKITSRIKIKTRIERLRLENGNGKAE